MTRFTRWSFESGAERPTNAKNQSIAAMSGGCVVSARAGSHPPGSLKTTTSPRSIGLTSGTSWFTMMRSSCTSVCSIDCDGMKNDRMRNVLMRNETSTATTKMTSRSRRKSSVLRFLRADAEPARSVRVVLISSVI